MITRNAECTAKQDKQQNQKQEIEIEIKLDVQHEEEKDIGIGVIDSLNVGNLILEEQAIGNLIDTSKRESCLVNVLAQYYDTSRYNNYQRDFLTKVTAIEMTKCLFESDFNLPRLDYLCYVKHWNHANLGKCLTSISENSIIWITFNGYLTQAEVLINQNSEKIDNIKLLKQYKNIIQKLNEFLNFEIDKITNYDKNLVDDLELRISRLVQTLATYENGNRSGGGDKDRDRSGDDDEANSMVGTSADNNNSVLAHFRSVQLGRSTLMCMVFVFVMITMLGFLAIVYLTINKSSTTISIADIEIALIERALAIILGVVVVKLVCGFLKKCQ